MESLYIYNICASAIIAVSPMNKLYVLGICSSDKASDQSGWMASALTFTVSVGVGSGSGSGSGVGVGVGSGSGRIGSSSSHEAKQSAPARSKVYIEMLFNINGGG